MKKKNIQRMILQEFYYVCFYFLKLYKTADMISLDNSLTSPLYELINFEYIQQ